MDVIPVSDPNAATMAQKITQYQAVLQLSATAPQIYNLPLLHRQMIEVLGVKNANKLVPTEDDEIPTDPIQENQDLLTGKPVKAFMEQDHKAHIQVHQLAMQDPKIMQLVGQNPRAQMIQAAMMAHLNEHIGFEYRRQIQEKWDWRFLQRSKTRKFLQSWQTKLPKLPHRQPKSCSNKTAQKPSK